MQALCIAFIKRAAPLQTSHAWRAELASIRESSQPETTTAAWPQQALIACQHLAPLMAPLGPQLSSGGAPTQAPLGTKSIFDSLAPAAIPRTQLRAASGTKPIALYQQPPPRAHLEVPKLQQPLVPGLGDITEHLTRPVSHPPQNGVVPRPPQLVPLLLLSIQQLLALHQHNRSELYPCC